MSNSFALDTLDKTKFEVYSLQKLSTLDYEFWTKFFFLLIMNFNENDLWRDKPEHLNLRISKLPSLKVLSNLEFDTEAQVLFVIFVTTQGENFIFFNPSLRLSMIDLGSCHSKLYQ